MGDLRIWHRFTEAFFFFLSSQTRVEIYLFTCRWIFRNHPDTLAFTMKPVARWCKCCVRWCASLGMGHTPVRLTPSRWTVCSAKILHFGTKWPRSSWNMSALGTHWNCPPKTCPKQRKSSTVLCLSRLVKGKNMQLYLIFNPSVCHLLHIYFPV